MGLNSVSVEGPVGAPPADVFRYIADMQQHHPHFLPPAFSDFAVVSGGVGAGTVTTFKMTAGGRTRDFRMTAAEPQPGRRLVETDANSSSVTTFIVDPADGGTSKVTIGTEWQGASGIGGFFERMFAPRVMRAIYADELRRLDAYVREPAGDLARPAVVPAPAPPATSIADVISRMMAIDAALPAGDGVACFNRMYLEVTRAVDQQLQQGLYGDAAFVSHLDVVFANLYFAAVDSLSGPPSGQPAAWQPLLTLRATPAIEPIQFALAGMNAHINHDLPLAVVATCTDLGTAPDDTSHHDDYQKVDVLLDAAEQSIRESFEPPGVRAVDRHVAAVADVVANWSMNAARDVAWDTALALWDIRDRAEATRLLTGGLARTVAMASRGLLVAV